MRGFIAEAGIIELIKQGFANTPNMVIAIMQNLVPITIVFVLVSSAGDFFNDPMGEGFHVHFARTCINVYTGLMTPVNELTIPWIGEITATNPVFSVVLMFGTIVKWGIWLVLTVNIITTMWAYYNVINGATQSANG